ncbi:hypothetical protein HYU89_00725 [Candidatus Collierbacteria bacterium]|nr:hypothetical protein [Candidatus Collierbacteria bacterium]
MKTIVTHINPDQDAISSVWLVKRFFPGWDKAEIKFVPAGKTLNSDPPDNDPEIIHMDTGLGKFDHHTTGDKKVCAAIKVLVEIEEKNYIKDKITLKALERMAEIIRSMDHAEERSWPNPVSDRWEFMLEMILDGLKTRYGRLQNQELVDFGMTALDGILAGMREKISASEEIATGVKFNCRWGKSVGVETGNDMVHRLAERMGFSVVAVKDPKRGNVRIYGHPDSQVDLTEIHLAVMAGDREADWFLHASKKLLLNGSRANPAMRPTKLTLNEIIKILSGEK